MVFTIYNFYWINSVRHFCLQSGSGHLFFLTLKVLFFQVGVTSKFSISMKSIYFYFFNILKMLNKSIIQCSLVGVSTSYHYNVISFLIAASHWLQTVNNSNLILTILQGKLIKTILSTQEKGVKEQWDNAGEKWWVLLGMLNAPNNQA